MFPVLPAWPAQKLFEPNRTRRPVQSNQPNVAAVTCAARGSRAYTAGETNAVVLVVCERAKMAAQLPPQRSPCIPVAVGGRIARLRSRDRQHPLAVRITGIHRHGPAPR